MSAERLEQLEDESASDPEPSLKQTGETIDYLEPGEWVQKTIIQHPDHNECLV